MSNNYSLSRQSLVKKTFGDDYTRKIWEGGEFGNQASFRSHPHTGVDYGANIGERIYAICDAEVTLVRDGLSSQKKTFGDHRDYGNFVMYYISYADVTVLDAHVKSVVKAGDTVAEGQYIAQIDGSGFSTAPHLHKGIAKGKFNDLNSFNAKAFDFESYTLPERQSVQPLDMVVQEVIRGEWGNGSERVQRLHEAGYDAVAVQNTVNSVMDQNKNEIGAKADRSYINLNPLYAHPKYGYYYLDDAPVAENIRGYLLPYKLGGISYEIISWSKADVVTVKTRDYGEVQLYVDPLRSTISETPKYSVYGG